MAQEKIYKTESGCIGRTQPSSLSDQSKLYSEHLGMLTLHSACPNGSANKNINKTPL